MHVKTSIHCLFFFGHSKLYKGITYSKKKNTAAIGKHYISFFHHFKAHVPWNGEFYEDIIIIIIVMIINPLFFPSQISEIFLL